MNLWRQDTLNGILPSIIDRSWVYWIWTKEIFLFRVIYFKFWIIWCALPRISSKGSLFWMYLFFFLLLFFLLCSNEKVLGYLMLQIMIVILQNHHDPISNKFCGSGNRLRPTTIDLSYSAMLISIVSLGSNILSIIRCNEGFQLMFPLFIGFLMWNILHSLACSHFAVTPVTLNLYKIYHPTSVQW